jgi:hypothetical protein
MPKVQTYLDMFTNQSAPVNAKVQDVLQASAAKRAELTPQESRNAATLSQYGNIDGVSTTAAERDFAGGLHPLLQTIKYGPDATNQAAADSNNLYQLLSTSRGTGDTIQDTALSFGSGLVDSVASIPGAAVGIVAPQTGAAISETLAIPGEYLRDQQSDLLGYRQDAQANAAALRKRDRDVYREIDRANGEFEFTIALRDFGRQSVDAAVGLADDAMVTGDKVSGVAGSLAGSIALSAGLGALPRIGAAAVPLAGAIIEGAGAFDQTVKQGMQLDHAQLMRDSGEYRQSFQDNLLSGMSAEQASHEAKLRISGEAGRAAILPTALTAAALGKLTPGVAQAAKGKVAANVRSGVMQAGGEALEEYGVGGVGQLSANAALQEYNPAIRVMDDVGTQATEGGILGFGSQGVSSGAGLAARGVASTAGKVVSVGTKAVDVISSKFGGKAVDALAAKGEAALNAEAENSSVAAPVVQRAAVELSAAAPDIAAQAAAEMDAASFDPVKREKALNYVNEVHSLLGMDIRGLSAEYTTPDVAEAIGNSANLHDAMVRIADVASNSKDDSTVAVALSAYSRLMQAVDSIAASTDGDILAELPEGNTTVAAVQKARDVLVAAGKSPQIRAANAAFDGLISRTQGGKTLPAITAENAGTAEGKQIAASVIAMAERNPQQMDAGVVGNVLKHATDGMLDITPAQRAALQHSFSVINAYKARIEEAKANGVTRSKLVAGNVISDLQPPKEAPHMLSANRYGREIVRAMQKNDTAAAGSYLKDLGKFAELMRNKVTALNDGYRTLTPQLYMSLAPDHETWIPSDQTTATNPFLGVTPHKAASVDNAQSIAMEAAIVADTYNSLVNAFPELNMKEVEVPSLVQELQGKIDDVVAAHTKQPSVVAASNKTTAATPVATKTESVNEAAAAPVTPEAQLKVLQDRLDNGGSLNKSELAEMSRLEDQIAQEGKAIAEKQKAKPIVAEAASKTEPVAEVSEEPVQETEPVEQDEALSPLQDEYPDLLRGEQSPFYKAFSLKKTEDAPTRIFGSDTKSVIAHLKKALGDVSGYRRMFNTDMPAVVARMNERLQKWADSPYSAKDSTRRGDLVATGEGKVDYLRTREGKALAITKTEGGKLVYDQKLQEAAVAAAFSYLMNEGQSAAKTDLDKLKESYGISMVEAMNNSDFFSFGRDWKDIVQAIASGSTTLWGVSGDRSQPMGYTVGIPLGVAVEVYHAMVDLGMIQEETRNITKTKLVKRAAITSLLSRVDGKYTDLVQPNKLIDALLPEAQITHYIGEAIPRAPNTVMHSPNVPLTAEDKQLIETQSKVDHKLDMPMATFYEAIGSDGLVTLFGEPIVGKPQHYNPTHLKSVEGKNAALYGAANYLYSLTNEMKGYADDTQTKLADVPVHFGYDITSVGRLQMRGAFNSQASKVVREVLLPTWSTQDFSTPAGMELLYLAVGQAIGVRVHQKNRAQVSKIVADALDNDFKPVLDMLIEWQEESNVTEDVFENQSIARIDAAALRKAYADAGVKAPTPVMHHALMEVARLRRASEAEKKEFRTSLYVEADGVTNGAAMSMLLMTLGKFTKEQIENLERCGIHFGEATTMDELYSKYENDLYTIVSDNTKKPFQSNMQTLANEGLAAHADSVLRVMSALLGGFEVDFSKQFTDADRVTLTRALAKNPLMVTNYGSGARGIADSLVGEMLEALYAKMSAAAQRKASDRNLSWEAAYFPNDPNAAEKFKALNEALQGVFSRSIQFGKWGKPRHLQAAPVVGSVLTRPLSFIADESAFDALRDNVMHVLVRPMREGIFATLGSGLKSGTELVQQSTGVMSVIAAALHTRLVEDELIDRREGNPDFKEADFLSKEELDAIGRAVLDAVPLVNSGTQNFQMSGTAKLNNAEYAVADSLTSSGRIAPDINVPSALGVGGLPRTNIGFGDARMMQEAGRNPEVNRSLLIFDGMHIPLDQLLPVGEVVNNAVVTAANVNVFEKLNSAFSKMMQFADLDDLLKSAASRQQLKEALGIRGDDLPSVATIKGEMRRKAAELSDAAKVVDRRLVAIKNAPLSVDQMAATGSPAHVGELDTAAEFEKLSAGEVAARLNEPVRTRSNIGTSGELEIVHADKLVDWTKSKMDKHLMDTLKGMQALLKDFDYTVVIGTKEQIADLQQKRGYQSINRVATDGTKGYIDTADKMIYLSEFSDETLVHEIAHALTYVATLAYYEGKPVSANVRTAIQNIEKIAADFFDKQDSLLLPEALLDAGIALKMGDLVPASTKAVALNEFIAWSLSNAGIAGDLQNQSTNGLNLKSLANAVWKSLKELLFGSGKAQNQLEAMRFNALLLAHEQTSMSATIGKQVLQHNARPHLESLHDALQTKLFDYIDQTAPEQRAALETDGLVPKALQESMMAQEQIESAFGNLHPEEANTFRVVAAALSTETHLDPAARKQVTAMYVHAMKQLRADMLRPAVSTGSSVTDQQIGEDRLHALRQAGGMPAFVALAMVNPEFRDVLAKIKSPESAKPTDASFDARMEAYGNSMLDALSARLAKQGNTPNVQSALDSLMNRIVTAATDDMSRLDHFSQTTNDWVSSANSWFVKQLNALSDAGIAKSEKMARSRNKAVRKLSPAVQLVSQLLTDAGADDVAGGLTRLLNQGGSKSFLRSLARDMMGRTSENADIYDLIKKTRSHSQQIRQAFRDQVPHTLADKFKTRLTHEQWTSLHAVLGKTDVAALMANLPENEVMELLGSADERKAYIQQLEKRIPENMVEKAKQLAHYMMTGEQGQFLLRNADAIVKLTDPQIQGADELIPDVDQLVTLYALESSSQSDLNQLGKLLNSEKGGISFLVRFMQGQRADELRSRNERPMTKYNAYKGYLAPLIEDGRTVVLADDANKADMAARGYVRIGDYTGSRYDSRKLSQYGYYYAPVASRASFEQGIVQNIHRTVLGVDANTGVSVNGTATRITAADAVKLTTARLRNRKVTAEQTETLMPIFDQNGAVVAYERGMNPAMLARLQPQTNLANVLGARQGRLYEETEAQFVNRELVDAVASTYETEIKKDRKREREFVDLFDEDSLTAVQRDAIKLIPAYVLAYGASKMDGRFMVRKDMLDDVIGRRAMSVGDLFTGMNDMDTAGQRKLRNALIGLFGIGAYNKLVKAERIQQNVVGVIKTNIIVRSVVVPAANMISNVGQLRSRGVAWHRIWNGLPQKTAEVHQYAKNQVERAQLMAEAKTVEAGSKEAQRIQRRLMLLAEQNERMSIHALVQAGEFSSITDVGITSEDIDVLTGKFDEWLERQLQKMPRALRTAAEYGYVSRHTALFRGLQKAVQYGDFVAKAVLYDHLLETQGMSPDEALSVISDEYVNYDRLPSRGRGYLESIGGLWFFNYKMRIAKIAMSMLRNQPLHLLLAEALPLPGIAGSPLTDNVVAGLVGGTLGYSVGPGMVLEGALMNPWVTLVK